MSNGVTYREILPPAALRRHVRCLWHLEIDAGSAHVDTVYPDGCCEIIAHRRSPMHAYSAPAGWRQQQRCVFAAQQRSAVRLAARGASECIGVRLQPAASAALARTPLADLRDRIVDLNEIDPDFGERFRVAATEPDVDAAIAALWAMLERHFPSRPIDRRIERAVDRLESCDGMESVAALIASSGMTARSFQGAFKAQVGLSAKEFARIVRLQATIRMLDQGGGSMAALAAERGFADEPHAIREVRRVTGTTPARLREALQRDRDGELSVRLAAAFVRAADRD